MKAMPLFSKESLETLRQKVDLIDLLGSFMELKRAGVSYKGLCPFHDERSPSFVVQKGDTHYHCFGCGAHGDAIQFLMEYQKMHFSESVEYLAQRFNVLLEVIEGKEAEKGPKKAYQKEALQFAGDFYHYYLLHTEHGRLALEYLYSRGLDLAFIQYFKIGLSPAGADIFRKAMYSKRFNHEVLLATGLVTERGRDFFSDRIMFPIMDPTGAVIGFSGRKFKEDTFGGKYVNTPETPLFKKSRILFGLNYSRRRMAKEHRAIIVEGQIDALRLIHTGFDITVAAQGTAFGAGHVAEMVRLGVTRVWLAMDPDHAGTQAAVKVGDLLQKAGLDVFVVELPQGSDPDTFVRKRGPDAFTELLDGSSDYLTFAYQELKRSNPSDTPAAKNELVQTLSSRIRGWDHPVMIQESLRKLAQLAGVPEALIGVDTTRLPHLFIRKRMSLEGAEQVNPDRILETDFLRWLLLVGKSHPHFAALARKNVGVTQLQDPLCRRLYEAYLKNTEEEKPCDTLSLVMQLDDIEIENIMNSLMQKRINRDRGEAQFVDTIQKMLDRNWMLEREVIRGQIQSGGLPEDEVLELVKQFELVKKNPPKIQLLE